MKVLMVDTTHGGAVLASEFSKKQGFEVFAWDIYHTLSSEEKAALEDQNVQLVDASFLDKYSQEEFKNPPETNTFGTGKGDESFSFESGGSTIFDGGKSGFEANPLRTAKNDELLVVAPVHCNIPYPVHMTHHEAVRYLLKDRIRVPVIEVTGVKGKTSAVAILKEIYRDENPLILSSLGVEIVKDGRVINLLKDISITPASIITAWKLAEEFSQKENFRVGLCIFESSLGGTGLAEVGVITNIAEDYSIAQKKSCASKAKAQMFESKLVVCDHDSYQNIYSQSSNSPTLDQKTNTYSLQEGSNLTVSHVNYGLFKTSFLVNACDLKTRDGKCINTSFECSTFAPADYHLENVLSAICSSLSMGTHPETIIRGLERFKGLPGRTSINNHYFAAHGGVRVFEEINPGINVTAVRKAVNMIQEYEKPALVLGGSYGVTCEEIDERSLSKYLEQVSKEITVILTGELGRSINDKMNSKLIYHSQIDQAVNKARDKGALNILLIFRSNYADLRRR
ncbi:MAG: coenzyme F430 synthase [Methanobacteriaceae archaeon]|nr:coenzyme F430 synthase [Methanobacteriaceae archaeon]